MLKQVLEGALSQLVSFFSNNRDLSIIWKFYNNYQYNLQLDPVRQSPFIPSHGKAEKLMIISIIPEVVLLKEESNTSQ